MMDKKEFTRYLDDIFRIYSFKKKGNKWSFENDSIKKVITIQKSKFGNSYYLNYGYIIKKLELQSLEMHIFNRLSSLEEKENKRIIELLNFENQIDSNERKDELKEYIEKYMLSKLSSINNENDILKELNSRRHLNDIPLIVKRYFNLPE